MNALDRKLALASGVAALACACFAAPAPVSAQPPAKDVGASMVQPPQPPASGVNAHNPDNMPVKRPSKPTNDPIARRPPASATHAK